MRKEKNKILVIGDGVTRTGFSTVIHNILGNLNRNKWDVDHLAVNYTGDPHEFWWKVYPASSGGDQLGFGRIPAFADQNYKGIFILNDIWVINKYLDRIKNTWEKKNIPPIIIYTPIDAKYLEKEWFTHFDIVSRLVVYTNFAKSEIDKTKDDLSPLIIPHGVDTKTFYKMERDDARKVVFERYEELRDSFVVLNANRNQPRKRIDLTLLGFKFFAEDKPENIKLYLHMGTKDAGWDILRLCNRLGLNKRVIITGKTRGIQQVPENKLNCIYNACNVGLNTSLGEGWGLVNTEHASVGAPQVLPNHSALTELFGDCGVLIPIDHELLGMGELTVSGVVSPISVAEKLNKIYSDKELYDTLSKKSIEKFTSNEYVWSNIVKTKWEPLFTEVFE